MMRPSDAVNLDTTRPPLGSIPALFRALFELVAESGVLFFEPGNLSVEVIKLFVPGLRFVV
jgi:hypothetical protein